MIVRRDEARSVWTVAELLKWTEGYFERLGLATPRLDAEVLLANALGRTRLELYTGYQMLVEPEERARFRALVERRAKREPVAYITGRKEFFSLGFEVSRAVLVPRPETEHAVEAVLAALKPLPEARALDLCTGSGAIAIAAAFHAPHVRFDAADISAEALAVARRNAAEHGVAERVRFFEGDLFDALPSGAGPYHAIVSNPPYVSAADYERLMDDVRLHEPSLALLDSRSDSRDGLGFYSAIAAGAARRLERGGVVVVEMGRGQALRVERAFEPHGFRRRETVRDLAGIERVMVLEAAQPPLPVVSPAGA